MKEGEFDRINPNVFELVVYYTLDENGDVIIDEEMIREDLDIKLKELVEKVECDDFERLVKDKVNKIKKEKEKNKINKGNGKKI